MIRHIQLSIHLVYYVQRIVTSVVEVLQEDYTNPFSPLLDALQLHSISSGVPVEDRSQVLQLLNMRKIGIELKNYFIQDHLVSGVTDPNLDLLCIRQSDAAPFFEIYAELYFDTKHLQKVVNRGW